MKNKILILAGDPNSINSEIISKIWKKSKVSIRKKLYLIANYDLINDQFKQIKSRVPLERVENLNDNLQTAKLKLVNIPLNFKNPFKVSLQNSKRYIIKSFNLAHKLAKNNDVKGFINCPINKKLLSNSGKIGVTEFLASKCKIKKESEVMLIFNKKLSVVPLTTHINIKDVSKKLNTALIEKKMDTLQNHFKKLFKKRPKIGILGLNPHNGELSKESEEIKIIIPSILKFKKKKISHRGAFICRYLIC